MCRNISGNIIAGISTSRFTMHNITHMIRTLTYFNMCIVAPTLAGTWDMTSTRSWSNT